MPMPVFWIMVPKELKERLVPTVYKVLKEVFKGLREQLVRKVHKEPQELKEDHKDPKEVQVHRVHKEQQVLREDHKGLKERQGHKVHKEPQGLKEVLKERKVLTMVV